MHCFLQATHPKILSKQQQNARQDKTHRSTILMGTSGRFWQLRVALMIIRRFLPFSFVEHDEVRFVFNPAWPVETARSVRRHIGELFLSWVTATQKTLREAQDKMCLPGFYGNADLWTSKVPEP